VLRELLADPTRAMYELETCAAAGLPSETIHPSWRGWRGLCRLPDGMINIEPIAAAAGTARRGAGCDRRRSRV
jgi:PadR family transcriptional regulator